MKSFIPKGFLLSIGELHGCEKDSTCYSSTLIYSMEIQAASVQLEGFIIQNKITENFGIKLKRIFPKLVLTKAQYTFGEKCLLAICIFDKSPKT